MRNAKNMGTTAMLMILMTAVLLCACDDSLDASLEDFRDSVPSVCKDYCEDRANCGREYSSGNYEEDQFAGDVHLCEVECGYYASEGAYVWYEDPEGTYDRLYYKYLSGDRVTTAMSCLYSLGAYRCIKRDGESNIEFNPLTSYICVKAQDCIDPLGIDQTYSWKTGSDLVGGTCQVNGADTIDSLFF